MIWIFFACSSTNYKMSAEMDEAQEDILLIQETSKQLKRG